MGLSNRLPLLVLVAFVVLGSAMAANAVTVAYGHARVAHSNSPVVELSEICSFTGSSGLPPCDQEGLVVSSDIVPSPSNAGFAAVGVFVETGQIKGWASTRYLDGTSSVTTDGSLNDRVTVSLAPGYSWPQTFIVRLIAQGTYLGPFTTGNNRGSYTGSFSNAAGGLNVPATYIHTDGSADYSAIHSQAITVSSTSTFDVNATLFLFAGGNTSAGVDYSTRTLDGIRFEIDLPASLVMTSESGTFLTVVPQDDPVVLPLPPSPGPTVWRFPGSALGGLSGLPSGRRYDPLVATGYEYQVIGAKFATVELPADIGDGHYELDAFNHGTGTFEFLASVAGGVNYHFELDAIDRFRVRGIEAEAALDPLDPEAFVTQLAFTGAYEELLMTPIVEREVPATSTEMRIAGLLLLILTAAMSLRPGKQPASRP